VKITLGIKLNAAILAAFIVTALVFSSLYLPSLAKRREESMSSVVLLLETLVGRDHDPLAYELFEERYRAVELRLQGMLGINGIRALTLYDPAGFYLLSAEADPKAPVSTRSNRNAIETGFCEMVIGSVRFVRYDAQIALGGEPIAYLEVLYSFEKTYIDQRRDLALYGGMMGSILVLVLTVLNILVSRIILKPIHLLAETMELIENEGPGLQINSDSRDEIGHLSRTFNRMSSALEESYRRISQQRRDLEESEEQYRALFENAGDALIIHGLDGDILDANQKSIDQYGYSIDELRRLNVRDLAAPEQKRGVIGRLDAVKEGGQLLFESVHRTKSGIDLPVEVTAVLCDYRGSESVLAILRDLRRRKELEEQLRQSQKMEAIGLLAGGIAHDFNNLLTTILGYSELIEAEEGLSVMAEEGVREIKHASRSAAALIQQLLAFSRKQTLNPEVLHLHDRIEQTKNMLSRLIGENIILETEIRGDTFPIYADPGQVEQVLINLTVNAKDAMPEGGRLSIRAENVHIPDSKGSNKPNLAPGDYVVISVSDTGHGIPEEIADHIFDPFFSTKSLGRGTGLGLSTVYGIVTQSQGTVKVRSEPGAGATFEVYFPAVKDPEPQVSSQSSATELPGGSETILLVEDEDTLRRMAGQALTRLGYSVIQAANGREALEIIRSVDGTDIDVVLTDVIMPEMGGRELAGAIRRDYPNIKILLMSGYADLQTFGSGREEGFLKKPFSAAELSTSVREILDL
jgi:PAS domain S-box-containing protein